MRTGPLPSLTLMDTSNIKLAPSILTADFGHMAEAIQSAEEAGADYIHLDVMDGQFVPNISFGPMLIRSIRQYTSLPFDVHLMVDNPDPYIDDFVDAGANILTVHAEATVHLHRTLQRIAETGCKVGVALNPGTPNGMLEEVLPLVQLALVMSVNPGFGGQRFIEGCYDKLTRMRQLIEKNNLDCELEVDGGVGVENIWRVAQSGANVLVVGSAVYNDKASVGENLAALREALVGQ